MTEESFLKIVEQASFLSEERRSLLKDNASWMTEEERDQVAQQVETLGKQLQQNASDLENALEYVSDTVKSFKTEELPKIRKEQESKEHSEEQQKANQLLDDFS